MSDDNGRIAGPRAIALVGPFASGKTTLLEAILARTGAISRQGTLAEGNTVGDASPEARSHQMSVEVNIAETEFMGDKLTFFDCPGSIEFAFEAEPILPAVDLAIVVAESDPKKVPALQVILKTLEDRGVPHMMFLNKVDKEELSVREALQTLQAASSVPLLLRHIPIREAGVVTGFIDLALERAFVYREHAPSTVVDVAGDDQARKDEARYTMLETLADYDDGLMEQLLEDVEPNRETVFQDLVADLRKGLVCPVLIGAAEHGHGIGRLLKAIRHESSGIEQTRARLGLDAKGETVVQIVKTLNTPHAGKVSVARVLAGSIGDGSELTGPDGPAGRVSGVFQINGQQMNKRDQAAEGETVGLGKLDEAPTGATLGTGKTAPKQLVTLTPPQPVLSYAVAAAERKDDVKLSSSLAKAAEEDPSLDVSQNAESGETVLAGQGEMHLRVALERMTNRYGIDVVTSEAAIPYRETIRGSTTIRGRHKKQSGGHGQFGDVVLEIKPLPRGTGFEFSERITGGVVPRQYISSVEGGVTDYLERGPLGFNVVDLSVCLTDGSYHTVDSSDQAFRMAAQLAMREGMAQCTPVLLEPVLHVEVAVPADATAKVNAIVSQRRGQLMGFDARPDWPGWDVVVALIPQSEIRDLIVELRSATAGVGTFNSKFDHLQELTGRLADEAVARASQKAA
jgi:elongation factor G